MLLLLASLIASAADPAPPAPDTTPVGPQPSHEVLRPEGLHDSGRAVVPGPPAPCMAKAQVYVPWALCKGLGAPRDGAEPLRLEARAQAVPPLPAGTMCALVCTPDSKLANWSYLVPEVGYRGAITCPVSARVALTLEVAGPDAAPTPGATVQWQTDLSISDYVIEDTDLLDGDPDSLRALVFEEKRLLLGETRCPAGQPSR